MRTQTKEFYHPIGLNENMVEKKWHGHWFFLVHK